MTQTTATAQARLTIATGPSGRAMAETMTQEMVDQLQAHLNMERQSSAAIWFAERELAGFAEYLRNEGKQEQEHAAKFADYLISRGQTVELDTIEAPRQSWPDPEEVMANVFRMEADVTSSVLLLYSIAERASDQRTTVFLDPVVDDQRVSEHEAAYLLGRVKYANNERAAMMIIDASLRPKNNR